MKIERGLFDNMVVQRNRRNASEAEFSGLAPADGVLRAWVRRAGKAVVGFRGAIVGKAAKGRFSGCLKGLMRGGPYDIELRLTDEGGAVHDRCEVKNVLVGDVWILGGQSNMEGIGRLKDAPKPNPMVRVFHMDDRWAVAKDPIHRLSDAIDQVHTDLCGGVRPGRPTPGFGTGPGVAFGQRMRELTGVPQGLVACAHGGTSMSQWDPKLKKLSGKSLYGAMVRRFRKNGAKVTGVVWYQGCSDASPEAAPLYTLRMKRLIAAMRRDFGDNNLPVVMTQIARATNWGLNTAAPWNSVQDQQRRLSEAIRNVAVAPTIDLSLDDSIHISGRGQVRVGTCLAQAMAVLKGNKRAGRLPIVLKRISTAREAHGFTDVIVKFGNVMGSLRSGSRPAGFALAGQCSEASIYDVELDRNRALIHTTVLPVDIGEMSLHYGLGTDSYCNITDAEDRSLPVFGPIPLGTPRVVTPFVRTLRVSEFQTSAGKLHDLAYPKDIGSLQLVSRTFAGDFCDLHLEISKLAPQDHVMYYVCRFECSEPMRLAAGLGYDGPIKAWVNGKEIFHDPEGINPASPDKGKASFTVERGEHELAVALGTNRGCAWGIFLRFERLDVLKRLIRKGKECYALPRVLG